MLLWRCNVVNYNRKDEKLDIYIALHLVRFDQYPNTLERYTDLHRLRDTTNYQPASVSS